MKTVESSERSTGMGATRFTAVAIDGAWTPVSRAPSVRSHGRSNGVEMFSVEVPDTTRVAPFYRSKSGREEVTILDGPAFGSFEDADVWLAQQAGHAKAAGVCPTCGRTES